MNRNNVSVKNIPFVGYKINILTNTELHNTFNIIKKSTGAFYHSIAVSF